MLHGNVDFQRVVSLIDLLGGEKAIATILESKELTNPKYGSMTLGQFEALVNALGGQEEALAIVRGEKEVNLADAIIKLADKNGRRIPPRTLKAAVCDADPSFRLKQPDIDPLDLKDRLCLFENTGLVSFISVADFVARTKALLAKLKENEQTANLLKGVHLPIVVPKTEVKDYGKILETDFIPAVEKSYRRQFANRSFTNYRKDELEGQVTIVPGSRHEQLVSLIAKESVVGIYFPNPLQGFSVDAQREQVSSLPESFLLSGGIDTSMGWVMYPDVLGWDYKTPGNDCSALQWQSPGGSLLFRARDVVAFFAHRTNLSSALSDYSGGLFFLG